MPVKSPLPPCAIMIHIAMIIFSPQKTYFKLNYDAGVREADEVFRDRYGLDPEFWGPETRVSDWVHPGGQLGKLEEKGGWESKHAREQILKDLHIHPTSKGGEGQGGEVSATFHQTVQHCI